MSHKVAARGTHNPTTIEPLLFAHLSPYPDPFRAITHTNYYYICLLQIIHKKENIQASRLWENERERIAFWENCDRYFEEHECTTAGQFFEVIAFRFQFNFNFYFIFNAI